jgi:hypothetical protein
MRSIASRTPDSAGHSASALQAKALRDDALGNVFLMNNAHFVVTTVEATPDLSALLGLDWVTRHRAVVQAYVDAYQVRSLRTPAASRLTSCCDRASLKHAIRPMSATPRGCAAMRARRA